MAYSTQGGQGVVRIALVVEEEGAGTKGRTGEGEANNQRERLRRSNPWFSEQEVLASGRLRTRNEKNRANESGNVKERWLLLAMRAKTIVRVLIDDFRDPPPWRREPSVQLQENGVVIGG